MWEARSRSYCSYPWGGLVVLGWGPQRESIFTEQFTELPAELNMRSWLTIARPLATMRAAMCTMSAVHNPLLAEWRKTEPFGLPPFGRILPEHFKPAILVGMDHELQELRDIVDSSVPPTFDNTIAAFDRCGGVLGQTGALFSNLCASNSPPELQAVQLELAPLLAAHRSKVAMYPGLFERVAKVHDDAQDDATLTVEQRRLVERIHLDFVRSGAKFDSEAQARYAQIMERLSTLMTQFQQNVMSDESDVFIELTKADLDGCPDFLISAARSAAITKGRADGCYVITLSRSLVEPFLTFSPRRDLREKAWRLWTSRGQLDPTRDNHKIAKEVLQLRAEQAELHGFESFAAYQNSDSMAQTPARVMELLERVWTPACAAANAERAALEDFFGEGGSLTTYPPPTTHHPPLTTYGPPFTTHHPPLTTHHSHSPPPRPPPSPPPPRPSLSS